MQPIENDEQHAEALAQVMRLIASDPDGESPEGMSLSVLAERIEAYEKERFKMPEPFATVYTFGVKRPRDAEPWFLAFTNQDAADSYEHRCTEVTAVHLYASRP